MSERAGCSKFEIENQPNITTHAHDQQEPVSTYVEFCSKKDKKRYDTILSPDQLLILTLQIAARKYLSVSQ
jgi:hypothetical protein